MEQIYDMIGKDFNTKRYKVWKKVATFLDSLASHTNLLEVGCGNGKNMLYRTDLECTGIDLSQTQIDICISKGLNVKKADMTNLPFNILEFDNIICIATYHHLETVEERKKALNEMYRVLKKGGKLLLSVWAMEQPENSLYKFKNNDEMVPWKLNGETLYRYYHIYKKGELKKEIEELCPEFVIESVCYDLGNWFIVVSK